MASLDRLEGDVIEGAILAVLGIVVILAYMLWKAGKALSLANLLDMLKKLLSVSPALPTGIFGGSGPSGPFDVMTGSNMGVQSDGTIGPGPDALDYIQPDPLQTLGDLPAYPLGS